jgi:hypothetical protein
MIHASSDSALKLRLLNTSLTNGLLLDMDRYCYKIQNRATYKKVRPFSIHERKHIVDFTYCLYLTFICPVSGIDVLIYYGFRHGIETYVADSDALVDLLRRIFVLVYCVATLTNFS